MRLVRPFTTRAGRDERGGVAIMFALSLFPLTLLGMGAVDYSRVITVRPSFQDALDAAALAVARSNLSNQTQMDTLGRKVLEANLGPKLSTEIRTSSFVRDGQKIVAGATMDLDDSIVMPDMNVAVSSEAVGSGDRLEIALVLDNTYSMVLDANSVPVSDPNATKLYQLKVAAKNFVDQLESASKSAEAGAVKISLVPFSNTVNVGTGYKTASWINPSGGATDSNSLWGSTNPNRYTLLSGIGQTWAGCVEMRTGGNDVLETPPTSGATLYTPYFAPDELDGSITTRNNYLPDVSTNSDYKVKQRYTAKYNRAANSNATPTTTFKTNTNADYYGLNLGYRYGPNLGCRLEPIARLTTEYANLRTSIDSMQPVGETIIPMGLAWGWNTLSPLFPWPEDASHYKGVAYDYVFPATGRKVKKIIVLMTDGDNFMRGIATGTNSNASLYTGAQYAWNGQIGTTSATEATRTSAIDTKLATLCTNIKAKDVTIYTIRVEVAAGTSTVLKNCATQPDMFYDVQQASQMKSAFSAIAGRITRLRLAR